MYLRAVLPLVGIVAPARPSLTRLVAGPPAQVNLRVGDDGATLRFGGGTIGVTLLRPGGVTLSFPSHDALSRFFAGRPSSLPVPSPALGLGHTRALVGAGRLLSALRVLEPDPRPVPPEERALRVRLLLTLVASGLSWSHRAGSPEMRAFAEGSPERVYQWTVRGTDLAAWLRVRDGRAHAGWGRWEKRPPFVHFVFADTDAAFAVLTATGSQMAGVRGGAITTWGSPEYTRKIALLLQKLDELLVEG